MGVIESPFWMLTERLWDEVENYSNISYWKSSKEESRPEGFLGLTGKQRCYYPILWQA